MGNIILWILWIVSIIAVFSFSLYRNNKKVNKIYNYWNVNDHLQKTINILDDAPWEKPVIIDAKVTKKQDKWIQLKYKDGTIENIAFTAFNLSSIECWNKIKYDKYYALLNK